MSIYKRDGSQTYSYDFQSGGRRFSGDTGKTSKREALVEERLRRDSARATRAVELAIDAPSTWELAASRYWLEVGQFHKNRESTLWSLAWLTRALGKQTSLVDIDDNRVAALVAKRRIEPRQVGRVENRSKLVGPATVNRTMLEPLRKVMVRAAELWAVPVGKVKWGAHMLPEPQDRVREANIAEEGAILGKLRDGYAEAVHFAFLNGCRRMEIIGLRWKSVDFFGRQFTVRGKGNQQRTIPMSDATFALLWAEQGHHTEHVFTYSAERTDARKKLVAGARYPMTDSGLKIAMRRAVKAAGVEDFRFHDTRHTAATRTLRASNLRVVQILLGHKDVATTTKYAHAFAEDVRAALNASTPTKSPTGEVADTVKSLNMRGKKP